jgi:hypothetical protein
MKRRTLLRGLASGIAGTVAGAAVTPIADASVPSHDAHEAQGQPAPPPAPAPPRLLDEHQRRTLASLAEMLVPGSTTAGVVDLIDRVAATESLPRQRRFLNALGAFEQRARLEHGARWIDLDEATRTTILHAASTAREARPRPPAWTKGQPLVFESTDAPPPATVRDHFDYLRATVATAYYSTERGMKELGWTGRAVWSTLPGCTHSDEHA